MPELPDIDYSDRYLQRTSLRRPIHHTRVLDKRILKNVSPQKLARSLKDKVFKATRRHGKFLFAKAGEGNWLVLHFGMTGSLAYVKDGEDPDYTRVAFDFDDGSTLAYQSQRLLGQVSLTSDPDEFVKQQGLGPDALSNRLTAKRFRSLAGDHKKAVKSFLMDQSLVAGIGNVYADEVLFQSGLRPDARADRLGDKQWHDLYRVMRRVLRVAARHDADVDTLPRRYLLPSRESGICPRCGQALETTSVAGRTTYFCARCQKGG